LQLTILLLQQVKTYPLSESFTAVKMHVEVFWVVTPCSVW